MNVSGKEKRYVLYNINQSITEFALLFSSNQK